MTHNGNRDLKKGQVVICKATLALNSIKSTTMVMMHAEEVDEGNIPSPASVFLRYASCVSAKTFIQPLPHKAVEVKVRERH